MTFTCDVTDEGSPGTVYTWSVSDDHWQCSQDADSADTYHCTVGNDCSVNVSCSVTNDCGGSTASQVVVVTGGDFIDVYRFITTL